MYKRQEFARLERFVAEAHIPFERRFYCAHASCARVLDVDPRARDAPDDPVAAGRRVACAACGRASCARCKLPWHAALRCAEVEAIEAARAAGGAAGGAADGATMRLIDATTKACPSCGFRISHYHGHACHHIRPGTGCPNCGTHFCYQCLRRGHSGNSCGCRLFCATDDVARHIVALPFPHDSRCGCRICPDCRPGCLLYTSPSPRD